MLGDIIVAIIFVLILAAGLFASEKKLADWQQKVRK